jgi:hypothetical protein
MGMHSPLLIEMHAERLCAERLREAAQERLAAQARGPRMATRVRLALALHALADWLEPCALGCAEPELLTT